MGVRYSIRRVGRTTRGGLKNTIIVTSVEVVDDGYYALNDGSYLIHTDGATKLASVPCSTWPSNCTTEPRPLTRADRLTATTTARQAADRAAGHARDEQAEAIREAFADGCGRADRRGNRRRS